MDDGLFSEGAFVDVLKLVNILPATAYIPFITYINLSQCVCMYAYAYVIIAHINCEFENENFIKMIEKKKTQHKL